VPDSTKPNYQPLYILCIEDKPETVQNVMESLHTSGIIDTLPSVTTSQAVSDNVHIILYNYQTITNAATKEYNRLLAFQRQLDESEMPNEVIPAKMRGNYERAQMQRHVDDYIASHARLVEQLQLTAAIEFVSTKLFISAFRKLVVLQTLLGEHGKSAVSKRNDSCHRSMGFDMGAEYGLLLQEPVATTLAEKADVLQKITDKAYLRLLLEAEEKEPTSEQAATFLKKSLFVPGYFQGSQPVSVFLHSIPISPAAADYQDVVFHLSGKGFHQSLLTPNWFAKAGFASIEIITNDTLEKIEIANATGTRRLRILHNIRLNDADFNALFQMAQWFAGCSGDKTLEAALSNQLIPFYQSKSWKRGFTDSWMQYAQQTSLDVAIVQYIEYFHCLDNPLVANLSDLAQAMADLMTPEFLQDWMTFIRLIHDERNYYKYLPTILWEGIAFHEIAAAIQQKNYGAASRMLLAFDGNYINFIFKKYAEHNLYDVLAFIYYFYPGLKKYVSIEEGLLHTLGYLIVKNKVAEHQPATYKTKQAPLSLSEYGDIASKQFIFSLKTAIEATQKISPPKDATVMGALQSICKMNITAAEQIALCLPILSKLPADGDGYLYENILSHLTAPRAYTLLMQQFFTIPVRTLQNDVHELTLNEIVTQLSDNPYLQSEQKSSPSPKR
jgi:hypothetical protein